MRTQRYVNWLQRNTLAIFAASFALVGLSIYLAAFHLPLQTDFSALLPANTPSVVAAEQLAKRAPSRDTMLVMIVAPDAKTRAVAADKAVTGIRALGPDLVESADADDAATRNFIRDHRHLYVPVSELTAVRDALAQQVADAKLKANPLFIELDDEPAPAQNRDLDELRAKQRDADAQLARDKHISADGRSQVIIVHTAFRATDVDRDRKLMNGLDKLATQIRGAHPFVTIGYAGGPAVSLAEHGALSRGIVMSSLITALLVSLVLFVHLRSKRALILLGLNILVATIISFGAAAFTVGHLNAATAFLGAIIAGNGVNYGILLFARYLEERRYANVQQAMATAISGTLMPTLVASLGAAIAYGALGATKFRGFADFALIGGVGMIICWIGSFVLLPAMIMRYAGKGMREPSPMFGRAVVKVFGFRRPLMMAGLAAAVTIGAGVISYRYLTDDPYEYDLTQLRSQAPDAVAAREWMRFSDETFGRGLAGLAGQTYVAVDRAEQVPSVVEQLKAIGKQDPIVGQVGSILDVVPQDQTTKLAVLADIRAQIDEIAPMLDDEQRKELLALRPADELAAVTPADLPPALARKLTERDGRVGLMIAVKPGAEFDERDGHDLIAFSAAVRKLSADDVTASGACMLFADVLMQIQKDGPLVTAIASIALIIMVIAIVGRSRRAVAVLVATGAGSIGMIAVCALAGLKINFLDFVALPITLGLGIDYAINIADRATRSDPMVALRSTGGTVLVCSLTTMIGYMSLLVSDNLSIRGFGLASLIGEITCVIAAFVVVPAIVSLPKLAGQPAFDTGTDAASSRA
ncbi:MAG TPA: MMPL family transporter [Kofleriaceae bacterium]